MFLFSSFLTRKARCGIPN